MIFVLSLVKAAVIDMSYFVRSAVLKELSLQEEIWLYMTYSVQFRTLILSREVEYLF